MNDLRWSDMIRDLPVTEEQHAEMIEGYMDGFDVDSPEASSNRSELYLYGFQNGREDRNLRPVGNMMHKYFNLHKIIIGSECLSETILKGNSDAEPSTT